MDFSDEELNNQYASYKQEAKKLLKDHSRFKEKLRIAEDKMSKIPLVGEDLQKFIIMVDMLRAYAKGEYKNIPYTTLVSITAIVAYIASPIDLVPDFIPILGFLDDAAIIKIALNFRIEKDLQRYIEWRDTHGSNAI